MPTERNSTTVVGDPGSIWISDNDQNRVQQNHNRIHDRLHIRHLLKLVGISACRSVATVTPRFCVMDFVSGVFCHGFGVPDFVSRTLCLGFCVTDFVSRNLSHEFCDTDFVSRIFWHGFHDTDFVSRILCHGFCVSERVFFDADELPWLWRLSQNLVLDCIINLTRKMLLTKHALGSTFQITTAKYGGPHCWS